MPPGRGQFRAHGRVDLALVLIAVAALGIRAAQLGRSSLWHDEALEFQRATGPLWTVLVGRPVDQDPPLFAALNRLWFAFGDSEFWLRVPSVLFGTGAVFLLGHWAGRRFGPDVGRLAALLAAAAPVQIHYSRELNQYALVIFLTIATTIAWEAALDRGSRLDWARYTALSAIALATHYGFAFPLAAMAAYSAHRVHGHGTRPQRTRFLVYVTAGGLVVWALLMLGLDDRMAVAHLQRRFGGTDVAKELAYVADIAWREILVFFALPFSGGAALPAAGLLSFVAGIGALALWHTTGAGRRVVGICFFGALAVTYPADGMGLYPMGHRYVLFAWPAFMTALAAGCAVMGRRSQVLGRAFVLAVLALFLWFSPLELWPNPYVSFPREELGPVARRVCAERGGAYVYYGAEPAFRYYRTPDCGPVIWGAYYDAATAGREARRVAALVRPPGTWVVFAHERAGDRSALVSALAGLGLHVSAQMSAPNATALLISAAAVR